MSDKRIFVDTNILVYAHDADAGNKHDAAQLVLKQLWENNQGVLSTQVLQEFYVTVTAKLAKPISKSAARDVIRNYQAWSVYSPTIDDVLAASDLQEHQGFSFWDALIVIAAQRLGAVELLSEDMQPGRQIGHIRIIDPLI